VGARNVQSDLLKIQQIEMERRNDECYTVELNLQKERAKCAVSNSSSIQSMNEKYDQ
jgi:hypothetical protein